MCALGKCEVLPVKIHNPRFVKQLSVKLPPIAQCHSSSKQRVLVGNHVS